MNKSEAWAGEAYFKQLGVFAISGDETTHMLWRLLNGELDGVQPMVRRRALRHPPARLLII